MDLYKWQLEELSNLEKQEMRAKKKTTGYAPVSRQRGKQKFTMDDLKEVMQKT